MEKKEWIEGCKRVFTKLVKDTLWEDFKFPNGGRSERYIGDCYDRLLKKYTISTECLVDFCVCQVSTIMSFNTDTKYRYRWNITHSFGDKAIYRFQIYDDKRRYYDDRWLHKHNLSRQDFLLMLRDRKSHPLLKYVFPEYEEHTKYLNHSSEIGYIICGTSTLMWTPFSPICTKCTYSNLCKERTKHVYPHLYSLRCETCAKQNR